MLTSSYIVVDWFRADGLHIVSVYIGCFTAPIDYAPSWQWIVVREGMALEFKGLVGNGGGGAAMPMLSGIGSI